MQKLTLAVLLITALFSENITAQKIGVKTNLLYGIAAKAPNLGVEVAINNKNTIELWGGVNPWNMDGSKDNNKKLLHWIVEPEWKYWFCSAFNGHYLGLHAIGSMYNINKYDIPLLFDKKYRYEGYGTGGGISYGYQWLIGKRWNIEASIGLGAIFMNYDKYECPQCGFILEKNKKKVYYGPTKAAVSVIYIIK